MKSRFVILLAAVALLSGCSFFDPEGAKKKYVEKGNEYADKGKLNEAGIMYQRALQKDKRFDEAWYRLALLQVKQNNFSEAISSLRRAVEVNPKHPDAPGRLLDLYSLAYGANPKQQDAIAKEIAALVKTIQTASPNSYDAIRGSALLDVIAGKFEPASQKFKQALDMKEGQVDIAVAYGQTLLNAGHEDDAVRFAEAYVAKHKDAGPVYDLLIGMAARRKDLAAIEKTLLLKTQNLPDQPLFRLNLARFYAIQGQPERMTQILDAMLKDPKRFPTAKLLVGDFYIGINKAEDAEKQYQQGWDEFKGKDRSLYGVRLADMRIRQRKPKEAEAFVDQVIAADADNKEAKALKALLLLDSGQKDKALDALKRLNELVTAEPRNSALRYHLGRAQRINGEIDNSLRSFQESMRLNPENLFAREAASEVLLTKGDNTQAVQTTTDTLSLAEAFLPARLLRAEAYLNQGEKEKARADIAIINRQAPKAPESLLITARLNLLDGNYKEAEAVFRAAFDRNDSRAFGGLIDALTAQRRYKEAQEIVQVQIAANPKALHLRSLAAELYLLDKDPASAAKQLQAGIDVNPKDPLASQLYARLAAIRADAGDVDSALSTLQQARQLNPKNLNALLEIGQLYERKGDKVKAMEAYRAVLAVTQNEPIALNNLAYTLADLGQDLDTALNYARLARQLKPDNAVIADTLGFVYIKKGLNDNAISLYKELFATPQNNNALFTMHLGMAYLQKGDKAEAKRVLSQALKQSPSKQDADQIRALLAKAA